MRLAGVYIVAEQALSERSEDILLSDRQRAEGFRGGGCRGVAKLYLENNES
ncbi:MAG: hypothetical protein ACI8U4_001961, partial [Natronomonas sp.]